MTRPLPISFRPDYGSVVTRVLPAILALLTVSAAVFLVADSSGAGFWLGVVSLAVGGTFLGLYLWFLVYREIRFTEEGVTVRRYLGPPVEGGYEHVEGVSSTGFRLDGFPVTWHTMTNGEEIREIMGELEDRGLVTADDEGGVTRDMALNRRATVLTAAVGTLFWVVVQSAGLVPDAVPSGFAAVGVIVASMLIGAPLIKRYLAR